MRVHSMMCHANMARRALYASSLLVLLSACTQPAAQVTDRGNEYFDQRLASSVPFYTPLKDIEGGRYAPPPYDPSRAVNTWGQPGNGPSNIAERSYNNALPIARRNDNAGYAVASAVGTSRTSSGSAGSSAASNTPAYANSYTNGYASSYSGNYSGAYSGNNSSATSRVESVSVAPLAPVSVSAQPLPAPNASYSSPSYFGAPKEKPSQLKVLPSDKVASAKSTSGTADSTSNAPRAASPLQAWSERIGRTPDVATPPQISFIWPVEGKVISRFGPKSRGMYNEGINIASREGEPIWAVADGEVIYVGNQLKGYGNMLLIRHHDGFVSTYAHASRIQVKKGEQVKQGQLVAQVGTTGNVSTAQLHFGLRQDKRPVDPEQYLARNVAWR